jgi:hypothetical protein
VTDVVPISHALYPLFPPTTSGPRVVETGITIRNATGRAGSPDRTITWCRTFCEAAKGPGGLSVDQGFVCVQMPVPLPVLESITLEGPAGVPPEAALPAE